MAPLTWSHTGPAVTVEAFRRTRAQRGWQPPAAREEKAGGGPGLPPRGPAAHLAWRAAAAEERASGFLRRKEKLRKLQCSAEAGGAWLCLYLRPGLTVFEVVSNYSEEKVQK